MDYKPIRKNAVGAMPVKPNLIDYEKARATFTWEDVAKVLDWFEDGKINIAYQLLDRHLNTPLRDKVALYWEGKDDTSETYTFLELSRLSNRFANALKKLGVTKGDRIFTLAINS